MKKKTIFLLTILLMAIFVTSCSSDDDNEKTEFTSTLTVNGSAWKIQCKLPPKTKRFCPLVLK